MIQKQFQKWFPPSDEQSSVGQKRTAVFSIFLIISVAAIFFYAIYSLPYYGDWDSVYYHVGRSPLAPYSVSGFLNPAWMAWILAPFAILPPHLSGAVWMTLAVLLTVWSMHRLQAGLFAILLCLLSPAFIRYITSGQIGIVPLLGFIFLLTYERIPLKGLGLILMSVKPQVLGGGALSYWLNLNRHHKLLTAIPLVVVLLLSVLMYGFWPLQINPSDLNQSVDMSPWPYGIPVGLFLLGWSIWKNKPILGGLATYLLVPYVSPSSLFIYTAVLFSKVPKWVSVLVFIFLWAFALLYT